VAALALAAAIGVGDELLQGTLADRQFDPWDVVGNTVASAAAVLLARGGRGAWGAVALLVAARLVLPVVHPGHPGIGDGADGSAPTPLAAADEPALDYAGAPILLVTVDALRADFVAPWGASPVPTPVFSRLARESVSFDEVFANSIWTTPSMVSFLVGLGPAVHGVQERGRELAPSIETPLEALVEAGWRTLGYAGDETETYRNLGFQSELDRDGDMLAEVVSALASPTPTFVWLHLRDVHAPYDATPDRLAELGLPAELPVSPILDRARTGYTVPRADFPGHHGWLKGPIRALYALRDARQLLVR
jgi:hypothetical protein